MSIENGMELYIFDGKGGKARYVRADVALRYARMRERKAYVQGFTDEAQQSINVFLQQSSQREYHIEKCHTCNRIKTACVCGLRDGK